jgi:F0F1-type ATP synthase membrane subunit c/vacuolar-type H+-ATPase subunit K
MKNHDLLAGKLPDTDTCQRNYYQIVKAAWAGLKKALALCTSARFAGIFFGAASSSLTRNPPLIQKT